MSGTDWAQPLTTIILGAPAGVGLVVVMYRLVRTQLKDLVDGQSRTIADTRDRVAALEDRVEELEHEIRTERRRVRFWQDTAHRLWSIVQVAGLTVPASLEARMTDYDREDGEGE